jgi:hypothetical protein
MNAVWFLSIMMFLLERAALPQDASHHGAGFAGPEGEWSNGPLDDRCASADTFANMDD